MKTVGKVIGEIHLDQDLRMNQRASMYLGAIADPGSDPDKFLCYGVNGLVGYRTGAEVLSDIGALGSSATAAAAALLTTTNVTLDSTCFPTFVGSATGNLVASTNAALTFNSTNGALGTTSLTTTSDITAVGTIHVDGTSSAAARLELSEDTDDGAHFVRLSVPALAATYGFTFPDSGGTDGYTLITDGSGTTRWADIDHDALTNFVAGEHYTQANIVATGTIASGVWNGTAIASAYLDTDTAHLTTTQTFTGDKTFSAKCTVDSRVYALPGTSDGDHAAGDVAYFGGTTSMTAGKCYYFTNGGVWALSNGGADATATGLLAIALGAASDVDGMLLRGMVTPYSPAGSDDEGKKLYLRVQDGTITTAIPTSSGNFVRIVGYMLHASNDAIYFCPDNSYVEVA